MFNSIEGRSLGVRHLLLDFLQRSSRRRAVRGWGVSDHPAGDEVAESPRTGAVLGQVREPIPQYCRAANDRHSVTTTMRCVLNWHLSSQDSLTLPTSRRLSRSAAWAGETKAHTATSDLTRSSINLRDLASALIRSGQPPELRSAYPIPSLRLSSWLLFKATIKTIMATKYINSAMKSGLSSDRAGVRPVRKRVCRARK